MDGYDSLLGVLSWQGITFPDVKRVGTKSYAALRPSAFHLAMARMTGLDLTEERQWGHLDLRDSTRQSRVRRSEASYLRRKAPPTP